MKHITTAFVLVLAFATVVHAGQRGKKYGEHTIHGMKYDRAAIEKLLDDSEVPAEVTADERSVQKLKGKFKLDRSMKVADAAVDFIDQHRNAFKLKDPKKELKTTRIENHKEGDIHVRYQQTYDDIPVWGQEIIVHINKGHDLDRIIADNVPTPDIDTTPLVTKEEAVEIAKGQFDKKYTPRIHPKYKPRLVIYNDNLAYEIHMLWASRWYRLFIDAKDGRVLSNSDITAGL